MAAAASPIVGPCPLNAAVLIPERHGQTIADDGGGDGRHGDRPWIPTTLLQRQSVSLYTRAASV